MKRPFGQRTPTKPRFNGAAPLWARRYVPDRATSQGGKCFNGAAPLWARRSPGAVRTNLVAKPLQWGRAFVGAEMTPCETWAFIQDTLQWGRAFVGAEIRRGRADYGVNVRASMGPRLCGRGDAVHSCCHLLLSPASMGPRLCGRGDPDVQRQVYTLLVASMGPRLCGRGDEPVDVAAYDGPLPLQWGRAFVGAEIPRQTSFRYRERPSFNGAAPLWARRFRPLARGPPWPFAASMGPRLCGRGDAPCEEPSG